jgi:signal transduction histidine kinase
VHHLDYPLLRRQGEAVLLGVFMDVLLIMGAAMGLLALVVGDERRALAARNAQLAQLPRLLLNAQEDERRRISRELHDQAGQALTAVKIELDLEGRHEASARVGQVLNQVRDVSNLLRSPVLDDLGLEPALRAMLDDFTRRTTVRTDFESDLGDTPCSPAAQVAIYRMVQEGLTNVTRHAAATQVSVRVRHEGDTLLIGISDDGRGAATTPAPHLGLLGMNERIAELGGSLQIETRPAQGFRLTARLPMGGMG